MQNAKGKPNLYLSDGRLTIKDPEALVAAY